MEYSAAQAHAGLFVSTYSGRQFYPLSPCAEQIDIGDIAHGLAYQCRFNGQTRHFYSVAQHSLIVAGLVAPRLRFAALLHDAAEAYLGDLVKPLKQLFPLFSTIEAAVMQAIAQRFAIADASLFFDPQIKQADLIALATEKRDLMPDSCEAWESLRGVSAAPEPIVALSPGAAKAAFLAVFEALRPRPGSADSARPSV